MPGTHEPARWLLNESLNSSLEQISTGYAGTITSGFPFRWVYVDWYGAEDTGPTKFEHAWTNAKKERVVPLGVRWLPMLVNLAMFWLAWFLALGLVQRLISRSRRRRGQCTKCRYALAGLSSSRCPECGTPI